METIKRIRLMDNLIAVDYENSSTGAFFTPVDSDVFDLIIKNIKEQKDYYEVTFKQLSEESIGMDQRTLYGIQIAGLDMVSEVIHASEFDPLSDKKDSEFTVEAKGRLKGFDALHKDGRKVSYKVER